VNFVNIGAGAARNFCMFVNGSTFPARAQLHEFCHSLRCHDTYVAVAFHLQFIGGTLYVLERKSECESYILCFNALTVRNCPSDFKRLLLCVCVCE
jgi:hypothetical protein